jgi:hypothetical protein
MQRECLDKHDATHFTKIGVPKKTSPRFAFAPSMQGLVRDEADPDQDPVLRTEQ